jgi:hypothetical protein
LVKLELEEMMEGIRQDGIDKVWWDCEWRNRLSGETLADELIREPLCTDGDVIRPTTLLEPQRKVEDGAGLDDLDLWTIQWKRFG